MFKTCCFGMRAALTAALVCLAAAERSVAADAVNPAVEQAEWIALLESDAPPAQKAITCKRLALYGTEEAVPALAALLSDDELADWARIALEAIPGPAADEALRQSLARLQGRLLVGAINSLAVRGDAGSVDALVLRLKDADAEVAAAAAAALGRIGGDAAVEALQTALAAGPAAVRSAAAEGCILCAEKYQAAGRRDEAIRLFDRVRRSDLPKPRVVEATRGAILVRGAGGIPLLIEQLRSSDPPLFAIGLRVARELGGPETTAAVIAELAQAPPERQALLLLVLGDRGETAALPAVLAAAESGDDAVRTAALRALEQLGDASCVPVLLEAAVEADARLAQTALSVLANLPGKEVDADVLARLAKAEGKAREVLIQLAGRRSIEAAVPALVQAADDADAGIRAAALAALGATVSFHDLPILIARVSSPRSDEEAAAATKALSVAAARMPDQEACAARLAAAMSGASVAAKCRLLEVLSAVGGAKALATVGAAAKDADVDIQDTASRLLGEWMSTDAAPVLLDLAKTAKEEKYRIRGLRGYLRLARQFAMPEEQRAAMCRAALAAAERDAERLLVLEVLDRYPSLEMLEIAVETAKRPALKTAAGTVALAIAQRSGADAATMERLLAQVGQSPMKIEIVKAEYGEGSKWKDVTAVLQRQTRGFPVIVLPTSNYNAAFGGDPAPGVAKQLRIQYRIDGKAGAATFNENASIMLPMP